VPIVEAGLAKRLVLGQDGRLTFFGYLINVLIVISCIATLVYPLLSHQGAVHFSCIFKGITGWPCPGCGYSDAMGCLLDGDYSQSFLQNPGWIIWVAFQGLLVFTGLKSLINGRQAIIGKQLLVVIIILTILIWTAKFLIGPEYY
jgi:hypothetical protein